MSSSVLKLLGIPPKLQEQLTGIHPASLATLFSLPFPTVNWLLTMGSVAVEKVSPTDGRLEHHYAEVGGRRWHYVDAKPKGPQKGTVFLIHGFPDLWLAWRYQIPMLLGLGLRCIVPDCMGYGGTDAPPIPPESPSEYGFKHHADSFAAIADKIGTDRIIVGGHDWGGAIAYRFAQWYPELVTHVFSVATPFLAVQSEFVPPEALVAGPLPNLGYQLQMGSAEHVVEKAVDSPELIRRLLKCAYGGQLPSRTRPFTPEKGLNLEAIRGEEPAMTPLFSHEELEYYVEQFSNRGMNGPCNWYRTHKANFDDDRQIPEAQRNHIRQPTLFIQALKDDVLLPHMSAGMEDYIPNLTRAEVPASHWALWHTPKETNDVIRNWIQGVVLGGKSKL